MKQYSIKFSYRFLGSETIGASAIVLVKLKQFGVVQSWLSKKGLGFRILTFQETNPCSLLLIFGKTDPRL
jgi:hypothetical protein